MDLRWSQNVRTVNVFQTQLNAMGGSINVVTWKRQYAYFLDTRVNLATKIALGQKHIVRILRFTNYQLALIWIGCQSFAGSIGKQNTDTNAFLSEHYIFNGDIKAAEVFSLIERDDALSSFGV